MRLADHEERAMSPSKHATAHHAPSFGPRFALIALAAVSAAAFLPLVYVLPASMVLPAFSALAIVAAAVIALVAWLSGAPYQGDRITLWDVAGGCVFIGIAAAMISRPEPTVQLFGL